MNTSPIKFAPVLKQTLWGGEYIIPFKHLNSPLKSVGESWEVSAVPGSESTIAGGIYDGLTLRDLIRQEKESFLGRNNYARFGEDFPLLVKFIDARLDLSIQVHPDDAMAQRQGRPFGKNEMWYIIKNLPHAHLLVGLKHELSPQTYSHLVAEGTIADALSSYEVAPGDCFYLPPGRVHSIGAGCFLAEIQQTCDLTYRIFDFNRRDKNGNLRPLHTALAAEAINYNVLPDYQTHYVPRLNEPTSLVSTPYFKTSVCTLSQSKTFSYADIDSFIILVAVGGSATLSVDNTSAVNFRSGESIVLPAAAKTVLLTPTSADFRFLETYV